MKQDLYPERPILIIDDERDLLDSICTSLNLEGFTNIVTCSEPNEALGIMGKRECELVILDIIMPKLSGDMLLPVIIDKYPDIPVIIITALRDVETAIECMKQKAYDYMVKPVELNRLIAVVKRAVDNRELERENISLKKRFFSGVIENPKAFEEFISVSYKIRSIFHYVEAIAKTHRPMLVTGETGVGKEVLANVIHKLSGRKGEFVPVNIGGLDDHMFSDTLFGHETGAFTGAERYRKGLIERASDGTLFLDEIGDLNETSQLKVLRLLQNREYYQLGSDVQKLTNTRIVMATHHDLQELVKTGKFRKDLYFRLTSHQVEIPPLRVRIEDLPILLDYFLKEAARSIKINKPTPPEELLTLLSTYHFPGNVRELQSMVYDAVSLHRKGKLSMDAFKKAIRKGKMLVENSTTKDMFSRDLMGANETTLIVGERFPTIKEVEKILIKKAMNRANGNQSIASRLLGVSRPTLLNRLKKDIR